MTRPWVGYLLVAGVLIGAEVRMPAGLLREALFSLIAFAAVAAVLVGVRLNRPARRAPWYLLAAGSALWALGDLLRLLLGPSTDLLPAADVTHLTGYLLLGAALWTLVPRSGRRRGPRELAAVLDALIGGTAVTLVMWVTLVEPAWLGAEGSFPERVMVVLYPIGDAVLVAYLIHLGLSRIAGSPALNLLGVGFVAVLVADVAVQSVAYVLGIGGPSALDAGRLIACTAWGAAALHPAMARIREVRRHRAEYGQGWGRVAFLAAAVLMLPGLVLVETVLGLVPHTTAVASVALVMIALVVARMADMVRRLREQATGLALLADTDFLTGLLNRRRFLDQLAHAVADVQPGQARQPAVLVVGIDRFTEMNDTLGHRIGDELLRAVAARLRGHTRTDAAVARLGGDVFAVLLPEVAPEEVVMSARRLVRLLQEPFQVSELGITLDGGVGAVVVQAGGGDPVQLMHQADVALSAARERPGRVALYEPEMELGGALAPQLMAELQHALDRGHVVTYFQPQVDLATGRVVGAEALVRWQHPQYGLLGPDAFVPAAERTGLIRPLTQHVLESALAQCARWHANGRDLTVSVNLSVRNLLDPDLVEQVGQALERYGVAPSSLELEITETTAMVDPQRSGDVLGRLERLGVTLSIDDYGTGYGSLAYLQRLPVQRLKIDRSFVAGVHDGGASSAIVRSIVDLARHLGMSVVAEGVEDDATLRTLRDMRCDVAQGFGIARPCLPGVVEDVVDAVEGRVPGLLGVRAVRVPRPHVV